MIEKVVIGSGVAVLGALAIGSGILWYKQKSKMDSFPLASIKDVDSRLPIREVGENKQEFLDRMNLRWTEKNNQIKMKPKIRKRLVPNLSRENTEYPRIRY